MAMRALERFLERLEEYRYDPIGFCREVLEMQPHEGQQRWLVNSTATENALVTGNRWGKSHIAAAKRIWRCVYTKGWTAKIRALAKRNGQRYQSLNASITADQSKLVWFKAEAMLKGRKAAALVQDIKLTPFPVITFLNGSQFEARSTAGDGRHLLGHDYDDVNWDEAAYEKKFEHIRDNVLRMRLVDRGGRMDYTSTGNGRNEFGRYFLTGLPGEKKDPDLYSQTGPTFENPNVDHARLQKNMARMPERMRRQNILGEIVDAGGGFFSIEDLEACVSEKLTEQMRILLLDAEEQIAHAEIYAGYDDGIGGVPWHNKYPNHRYVHFWDIARTTDWTVGITLDTSANLRLVEFERFQPGEAREDDPRTGWAYVYERMRHRHRKYQMGDVASGSHNGTSRTYFDATGVGQTVEEALKDIRATGFVYTETSKDAILTDLQSALSLRTLEFPMIPVMYDECKFYEREDKSLVQDCVMALAGAVHFGKRKRFAGAAVI